MIKRLNLFANAAQTQLTQALVDKSHEKLKFPYIRKIFRNIGNQKYLGNLLTALKKNFKSSCYTLRIKSLIVLHYLLKKTLFNNERIIMFAQEELNEMKQVKTDPKVELKNKKKISLQNQQKQYIQKNIVEFYIIYLLKYIMHQKVYLSAREAIEGKKDYFGMIEDLSPSKNQGTTCVTQVQRDLVKFRVNSEILMLNINNGFEILNLINFIIKSQESFNKMGRYYLQHEEILNLFIMYLDDLTVYNDYTKKLAKILTKTVNYIKEDEIRHCFLYLTESQKTSDRLYEFYYNRYYYSKVKKLITMPTFLTIDNDDFQRVVKEIKKVDKELFLVVKESKYSENYRMNKTQMCLTEPTSVQNGDRFSKINKTMMTETGSRKMNFINKTIEDLRKEDHNQFKNAEKNFNRYFETFEDIFDDDEEEKTAEV